VEFKLKIKQKGLVAPQSLQIKQKVSQITPFTVFISFNNKFVHWWNLRFAVKNRSELPALTVTIFCMPQVSHFP
jgi:hypothetical protein